MWGGAFTSMATFRRGNTSFTVRPFGATRRIAAGRPSACLPSWGWRSALTSWRARPPTGPSASPGSPVPPRAPAPAPRPVRGAEPAAGLNGAEVELLLERIQMLRRTGVTILLVEHNMDLVMKVADRVLVIDYGQSLFEGAPADVQTHAPATPASLGGGAR